MYPKVSVFVVHFNSMKAKDLAKENIKALSQLDYPDYEVIMVDNGSSDHTFEFLDENINDSRFKIIRSDTNTFLVEEIT
ncbi:glycosyltransferase family 2 protein [Sulfuracidifex metallicus]|uniref:glycosyltransferase family 2 protein n=1 Tax=Sulfuracidifex metallicus TaxID=47303 RepID=UPI0006D0A3FB|nr:glycosyltransferase family 2 protein [Sulfuracidifex metallicus]